MQQQLMPLDCHSITRGSKYSCVVKANVIMGVFTKALKVSCEASSMKALPRIVKASTHFQLILWSLALICGLGLGGYQIAKLLIQYFNFPTSVDIKEISGSPPFPDVTFCHQDPTWTANRLEIVFGERFSRNKYREKVNKIMNHFTIDTNEYNITLYLRDSFGGYLQNLKILDKEIRILKDHLIVDCSIVHFWDKDPVPCFEKNVYNVFLDPVFGMCVTIEDRGASELNVVLYLDVPGQKVFKEFKSTEETHLSGVGARLIIHPPGSFPDINFFSHIVLPGTEYDFEIHGRERIFLGEPYGKCVTPRSAEAAGRPAYDIYRHGYECYRMCSKHKILNACDCLHVYYNHKEKNVTFCGHLEAESILHTMTRMNCAEKTMKELEQDFTETCYCPKPCHEFEYDYNTESMPWPHASYHLSLYKKLIFGSPFADKFKVYENLVTEAESDESATLEKLIKIDLIQKNFARVRVLNHQWKYLRYQETPMLSIESIIGSVGGLCNIWAGISFFTIIEVVELVHQWLTQRHTNPTNMHSQKSIAAAHV